MSPRKIKRRENSDTIIPHIGKLLFCKLAIDNQFDLRANNPENANTDIINKFIQDSEEVFHLISLTIKNNNLMSCLQGEVISKGFKRLNS